jgi:hypothetical protein
MDENVVSRGGRGVHWLENRWETYGSNILILGIFLVFFNKVFGILLISLGITFYLIGHFRKI